MKDLVEGSTGQHGLCHFLRIGHPVAPDVDGISLALDELLHDGLLILCKLGRQVLKAGVCLSQALGPVPCDEEGGPSVVKLLHLGAGKDTPWCGI